MAEISLDVGMDLCIHEPRIVLRFLAWVSKNERYDEQSGWPDIGQLDDRWMPVGPFDLQRTNVYQAGDWLVGIPKEPFKPGTGDDYLYVHIYPNVPMQVFAEKFPKFLTALGVERFEIKIPRYLECVKRAVEFLEKGVI